MGMEVVKESSSIEIWILQDRLSKGSISISPQGEEWNPRSCKLGKIDMIANHENRKFAILAWICAKERNQ